MGTPRYATRSRVGESADLAKDDLQGAQDALELPPLLGIALEADRVDPELELGHVRRGVMELLVGQHFLGPEVGVLHLCLFGYVPNGHNVIRNSAARPGYGPSKYLIAV